jgi:hypothetical protein
LELSADEQAILAGSRGEAARRALEYQIEVMGDAGLEALVSEEGIAAGWAFYDIKWKKIAPKAFIFGVTNPVMVQGAVFAGIPITAGWTPHPRGVVKTGDRVRVDPARRIIELL